MTVKYMLMIYNQPGFVDGLSEQERSALFGEVGALMEELTASGELVGGQGLVPPSQARTVDGTGGTPVVTDGPFLESKEQFGGYVAVDCATPERALEIARRWPDVRHGGAIEVRAIADEGAGEA